MDANFELLEHPADIGFRARGENLRELFANCAHALVFLVLDPSNIQPAHQFPLSAEGNDYESLMVNWLNEVLYYTDSRRIAFAAFRILKLDESRIECLARGEPRDPERHPPKVVVKAVTYHQLKVFPTADGWTAEVYVDV
jgi:SHS2 domain-containing protein